MDLLKITIWPIIVTILLVISILSVFSQENTIVYIPTSQFGGLAYEQVEIDENCPAFLKLRDDEAVLEYESSVSCETYLSEQSLDELPFYEKDSLTDSLKEEFIFSENINVVDFLDASNDLIVTIPKEEGEYHLGIDSNIVIVTTFTYGTCMNCTINQNNVTTSYSNGNYTSPIYPLNTSEQLNYISWVGTSVTLDVSKVSLPLRNLSNPGIVDSWNLSIGGNVSELGRNNGQPTSGLIMGNVPGPVDGENATYLNKALSQRVLFNSMNFSNTTPYSFVFYYKVDYFMSETFIQWRDIFRIDIGSSGALSIKKDASPFNSIGANAPCGSPGRWNHAVYVLNGQGNISFYCNGVFDSTKSVATWGFPNGIKGIYLGGYEVGGTQLNGSISHVTIYNYTLTQAEIINLSTPVHCTSSPCDISSLGTGDYWKYNANINNSTLLSVSLDFGYCSNNISYYETSRVEDDCTLDDNQTTTIYYISTDLNDCGNYSDVYSSETLVNSCNYAGIQMQELREEFNMIAFVLLYAIFLCLGIYLLTKAQTVLGLGLIGVTIGMDFFLIQDLYTRYVQPNLDTSWMGTFTWIFGASFIFWIITKISMPILLAQKGKGV